MICRDGLRWGFASNSTAKAEYLYVAAAGTGVSVDHVNLVRAGITAGPATIDSEVFPANANLQGTRSWTSGIVYGALVLATLRRLSP